MMICTKISNGSIVEFKFDKNIEKFVPIKVRPDKKEPNRTEVATNVWHDIQKPISSDDVCGKTLTLAFSYHTRIKSELFANNCRDKIVLDIGSGKGGDINSWKSVSKIYCIEPNLDNLEELKMRRIESSITNKISFFNLYGEESLKIRSSIEQNVNVVAIMLSTSFFWKSPSKMLDLIRTILLCSEEKSKIIFMSINGEHLMEKFNETEYNTFVLDNSQYELLEKENDFDEMYIDNTNIQKNEPLFQKYKLITKQLSNLYPSIDKKLFGNKVKVSIYGGIVGENQIEYLVYLQPFFEILKNFGFTLKQFDDAKHEKFMPYNSKEYSKLYSYGMLER